MSDSTDSIAGGVTLTLLNPIRGTDLHQWTFPNETLIRLGRNPDNDVVIPTSVVSRYHAMLRFEDQQWELVGIGSNGTLLDGEKITHAPLRDGQVIGLAQGGPSMRFRLGIVSSQEAEKTVYQDFSTLQIEIDESKKQRQVSEITQSEYFQQLKERAAALRARNSGS